MEVIGSEVGVKVMSDRMRKASANVLDAVLASGILEVSEKTFSDFSHAPG